MSVLSARSHLIATGVSESIYEASLTISVTLSGPTPRDLVLTGRRSYAGATPLAAAAARAEAFDALTPTLIADAVDWLLYR